jgi:hypothetical protein
MPVSASGKTWTHLLMPKLRIDSRRLRANEDAKSNSKTGRIHSRFERIRMIWSLDGSTLVLLEWGFGEYYQCGYWAALENRGSRLLAAARGSNPLLSAALRDPRDLKACLCHEWFLTRPLSLGILKLVLKRGSVSFFQGGLTSRLSFLSNLLPGSVYA